MPTPDIEVGRMLFVLEHHRVAFVVIEAFAIELHDGQCHRPATSTSPRDRECEPRSARRRSPELDAKFRVEGGSGSRGKDPGRYIGQVVGRYGFGAHWSPTPALSISTSDRMGLPVTTTSPRRVSRLSSTGTRCQPPRSRTCCAQRGRRTVQDKPNFPPSGSHPRRRRR